MQPIAPPPETPPLRRSLPHRLWGGLPPSLRRGALARTTAWLAPHPGPSAEPVLPGLIVTGELTRTSGLGEGARLMARAARELGLPVWTIDLPPPVDAAPEVACGPEEPRGAPDDGVPLVIHVNAPMLPLALLRLPHGLTRHRRIIGYWAWELPAVPPEWHPALGCVDQVWVPSRFTAAALEPLLPGRVRVVPPPLAVIPPEPSALDRAAFGLPEDAVVVLVSFNLASSLARKNPFAAIAAFRAAFGDRADRVLVLKIGHPNHAPEDFSCLAQMARATNIVLYTSVLSAPDSRALIACADIVLSMHRSEGFGLVLAEAMLLGKPVIATGWSGNTDFMNTANAALVRYRLVPTRDRRAVYRDSLWAEPDAADAAAWLRLLADDSAARWSIGERGRTSVLKQLTAQPLAAALASLEPTAPS
jgi:glycosyltransferase involved in cell wall biosynthesis